MARRAGRDIAVGTLFALGLIVLALAVMTIGGESKLFAEKSRYRIVFPSADGLSEGSPVRMAGVQIGNVTDIRLPKDPTREGIEVGVAIDEAYAPRIRTDSRASLRILLMLSGEKFVDIEPGSPDAAQLPEGSPIELAEGTELLAQGQAIAENLTEITASLRNILQPLERGEGLIGQLLRDPEFGKEGLESLRGSLDNLERLTSDLVARRPAGFRGNSAAGRLLYDEELGARLDRLGQALDSIATVMERIERGDGALGQLLEEGGSAERAIDDFAAAAASLRDVAQRLQSPEGLVGKLLDPVYSEGLAADLDATLERLASVTAKIDSGQGTLGALINDRTVYEGLEDVVAGVHDSKFARWLLKHYRKRGIKAGDRGAAPPGE